MTAAVPARSCYWCGEPQVKVGSVIHQILDLLLSDTGTAWTPRQVADRLDVGLGTVRGELHRLAKADVIRKRVHQTHLGPRTRFWADRKPSDRSWPPTLISGYQCSCGEFLSNPNGHPLRIVLDAHRQAHLYGTRP